MALRLFLVGMVASLGLDVPTGWRVESWERAGMCWFESRQSELEELTETAPLVVDARVDEPPAAGRPLVVDAKDEAANKVAAKPAPAPAPAPIEVIEQPELASVPEPPVASAPTVPVVVETASEPFVTPPTPADAAFSAVVNQMVAGFAAPAQEPATSTLLATRVLELPQNVFATAPAQEIAPLAAEAAQPALASKTVEPAPAPDAAEWIGATSSDEAADASLGQDRVIAPKSAARHDRLITAVRLTRQALSAWAGVLEQEADVVAVQH